MRVRPPALAALEGPNGAGGQPCPLGEVLLREPGGLAVAPQLFPERRWLLAAIALPHLCWELLPSVPWPLWLAREA